MRGCLLGLLGLVLFLVLAAVIAVAIEARAPIQSCSIVTRQLPTAISVTGHGIYPRLACRAVVKAAPAKVQVAIDREKAACAGAGRTREARLCNAILDRVHLDFAVTDGEVQTPVVCSTQRPFTVLGITLDTYALRVHDPGAHLLGTQLCSQLDSLAASP